MYSSRSLSPVSSTTSLHDNDDLFKKFKLKHHRISPSSYENDDQISRNNSDDWTSQSTTPELDVESHFKNYYTQQSASSNNSSFDQYLLTPDIDELQRKENELARSLTTLHQQVKQIR